MKTIEFEGKKLHFDFSLGCINDIYIKELGGSFDDLINIQSLQNDTSKLLDLTRDMLLSGHLYYLFLNDFDDEAELLLSKLKSTRMKAMKWLEVAKIENVIVWIAETLMPSDVEQPNIPNNSKKKK